MPPGVPTPKPKNDPISTALDNAPEWIKRLYRTAAPVARAVGAAFTASQTQQGQNWARYSPMGVVTNNVLPAVASAATGYDYGPYRTAGGASTYNPAIGAPAQTSSPTYTPTAGAPATGVPGIYGNAGVAGGGGAAGGAPDWLAGTGIWKTFQSGPVQYSRAAGLDDVTGFSRWYFNQYLPAQERMYAPLRNRIARAGVRRQEPNREPTGETIPADTARYSPPTTNWRIG